MKKTLSAVLVLILLLSLTGCQKKIKGTDGLIEKAREVIPVSDSNTIEMQYVGMHRKGDKILAWFISGNEYQAHYYLPMECEVIGEDEYIFTHAYNPLSRGGEDDYVLHWQGGYSFIVNNPKCRTLKISDSSGTKEINIDENAYPFIYYNEVLPTAYAFLDAQGNELY